MSAMPNTDRVSRPTRKRTVVSTYNLKILNDNAHQTHKTYIQTHANADKHQQNSTRAHKDKPKAALPRHSTDNSTTSSLTSLMTSPQRSTFGSPSPGFVATVNEAGSSPTIGKAVPRSSLTTNNMMEFECFNGHANPRGHYYSAPALYACGVWIGYLAPDKQKKPYCGLPSFNELKANFADMSLPCPPSSEGTSANNRDAVCRGCFGDQSALLTLREVQFVNNRVSLQLNLASQRSNEQ
jgi:hypothetical protein